jgi:hypothetical protein
VASAWDGRIGAASGDLAGPSDGAPWWYNPYWIRRGRLITTIRLTITTPTEKYPYNPDASYDRDSPARYLSTPSANFDGLHFNLTGAAGLDNGSSDRNSQTPHPEAAPNGPAPAAQPQPRLVSQPQT